MKSTVKGLGPELIDALDFSSVRIFPPYEEIADYQLFSIDLTVRTTEHTHGLHRFPAKFIPQIPRWALGEFLTAGGVAVDPFMGSGTSLVEGLLVHGHTYGIDIDPLSQLIAEAKIALPKPHRIESLSENLISSMSTKARLKLTPPMPDIKNFGHWFSQRNWRDLQLLWNSIRNTKCSDRERLFLTAVFSSILRWVSNADDQSHKTYVSGTREKNIPSVRDVFTRFLTRDVVGLRELQRAKDRAASSSVLKNSSALRIDLPDESADLIVTSPPYLDSVDYMYNAMLEYFWLGPLIGCD